VKSGRRETTTRIHAVVDFRGAPPPGQARSLKDLMPGQGTPATPPASTTAPSGMDDLTPESILAALQASAGGQFIYYRIN
jgi:hypothetical protein